MWLCHALSEDWAPPKSNESYIYIYIFLSTCYKFGLYLHYLAKSCVARHSVRFWCLVELISPRWRKRKKYHSWALKGDFPQHPMRYQWGVCWDFSGGGFIQLIHMDSQGILYNNVYLSRTCWGNIASRGVLHSLLVYKPEKTTKNMYVYICVCIYLFIYLFIYFIYLFIYLLFYLFICNYIIFFKKKIYIYI